jgi:hypothetical protein
MSSSKATKIVSQVTPASTRFLMYIENEYCGDFRVVDRKYVFLPCASKYVSGFDLESLECLAEQSRVLYDGSI